MTSTWIQSAPASSTALTYRNWVVGGNRFSGVQGKKKYVLRGEKAGGKMEMAVLSLAETKE
jgi:hypothetical protein